MAKKKKLKLKKKRAFTLLVVFLVGIIGLLFFINNQSQKALKNAKKYYHKYVLTTTKTSLYNQKKRKVGTIEKNYPLELDTLHTKSKYFKIKNTDYYVYFMDVKKSTKKTDNREEKHYIVFNQNIKTNKTIALYQNNKKIITLKNGINLPIEYKDNKNYYISFLNTIFQVPRKSIKKEINTNNTKEKEAKTISILNYEKIEDSCLGQECTSTPTAKEQIALLKEKGYYMISKKEYQLFIDNNIRLKQKALLITTKEETDQIKKLEEELKISIKPIDTSNSQKIKYYDIKSYTTTDNLLKMANNEDVQETPPVINNQGIAVLNYHFFYDSSLGEGCNESICLDTSKFREHLDYLKENNYKTVTMEEFKRWMYGDIELPEKSVLITVDDGALGTGTHNGNKLIPLLEEYKMNATLFLIAGWWDINNYRSPYLTIQSHTFDMHQYGSCGRGQINCATLEEAKTDLQKSLDVIGNNDSFCFPFYYYSDTSIQAVKDLGFKLAFVGGNRKATRNSNKYLVPRYPILSDITRQQFINIVS